MGMSGGLGRMTIWGDSMTHRQQYASGLRAGIPVILGFVPVGIAYAIMARQAGFSVWETAGMSAVVFAGASQMMAVGMYARGAGVAAMVAATFILNLRHMIMSACVMNRMKRDSAKMKLLAAFGVTDEAFAIFTTESEEHASVWFFLGLLSVTYLSWLTGSVIGAAAVNFLPAVLSVSLGIALYAMFLGLLVPSVKRNARLALLIVLTGIVNTVLSRWIASGWALVLSTLICAAAGVVFVDIEKPGEEQS